MKARTRVLALSPDERLLRLLHALLAASLPFFLAMALSGCEDNGYQSVDYGPEVAETTVLAAVSKPLAHADPAQIKVGEFVHFVELQELAGGQVRTIASETGQTVIDRVENETQILFTVVETTITYSGSESRKTSTEIPVIVNKSPSTASAAVTQVRSASETVLTRALADVVKANNDVRTSFHNLRVSVARETPPEGVVRQSGCLGIPDCQIEVHRVSFDQVTWESGGPNRVHFDFAMSLEAPYLGQLLDKCVTLMVPIGSSNGKTLLRQCNRVVSFRYEAPSN